MRASCSTPSWPGSRRPQPRRPRDLADATARSAATATGSSRRSAASSGQRAHARRGDGAARGRACRRLDRRPRLRRWPRLPGRLRAASLRALQPRRRGADERRRRPRARDRRRRRPRARRQGLGVRLDGDARPASVGALSSADDHDRSSRRHRPRPPEGGRHRARARLLRRRARLRAAAADGRPGRVHLRRRLPPPHRPEHVGEPRRQPAPARLDRALPHRHPLSRPRAACRRAAAASSRPGSRSRARPTTASARRST